MLNNFLKKELTYFQKLHQDARRLLTSIFLYDCISPLTGIFLNAFLWRQSQDMLLVAFYNLVSFSFVTAGFYLNGLLLRKFSTAFPFTLSLLVSGINLAVLMFLPTISYQIVFIFSIIEGLTVGVYWANRNLLTLKTTTSDTRIYFSSVETTIETLIKVIVPFVIGWFLVLGAIWHWYTVLQGYQILVIIMLFVTILIGLATRSISIKRQKAPLLFLKTTSSKWKQFRILEVGLGLNEAVKSFIPVLLVFTLLGNEEALGTVQTLSAILASIMVYLGVKSLHIKQRLLLMIIGVSITIIGAVLFSLLYSGVGVLIFFATQAIAWPFIWVALSSINYDLIDQDNKDPKYHYAYICDQEIYLNAGRVIGILLFIALVISTSNDTALRFTPLFFAATQVLLIITAHAIEKNRKLD